MQIQLNGAPHEVAPNTTIRHLLEILGYTEQRVAVEKNGKIVPKSQHAESLLHEHDTLEIVIAVGGG